MIDVNCEELISPREATRHPVFRNAQGRPGSLAAVYRAFNPGARSVAGERIRLETIKAPSGVRTSREAIARFVERLSDPEPALKTISPNTHRLEAARADAALDAAGIV